MKNVKNALSRNEMRNIFAGQLPGGGEFDGGKCKEKCKETTTNSECCSGGSISGNYPPCPSSGGARVCM